VGFANQTNKPGIASRARRQWFDALNRYPQTAGSSVSSSLIGLLACNFPGQPFACFAVLCDFALSIGSYSFKYAEQR
jgi:hypothetical protein